MEVWERGWGIEGSWWVELDMGDLPLSARLEWRMDVRVVVVAGGLTLVELACNLQV